MTNHLLGLHERFNLFIEENPDKFFLCFGVFIFAALLTVLFVSFSIFV